MTAENPNKLETIAEYLEVDASEISINLWGTFSPISSDREYSVLTDDELDATIAERIKSTLYSFDPNFLSFYVDLGESDIEEEIIKCIQLKGERGNDILLKLVGERIGKLIRDAISSCGMSHFTDSCDGNISYLNGLCVFRVS